MNVLKFPSNRYSRLKAMGDITYSQEEMEEDPDIDLRQINRAMLALRRRDALKIVAIVLFPIIDTVFLVENTIRLIRAGFPIREAWNYSRNR